MQVDLRQTIVDYKNQPIVDANGRPQTLREYFETALNNVASGEVASAEDKSKCYQLSTKFYASNTIELSLDDRSFLKKRIEKIWLSPLICGRLTDILEERNAPEVLPEEDLTPSGIAPRQTHRTPTVKNSLPLMASEKAGNSGQGENN